MKDLEERHVETQIERLRAAAEAHRALAAELEAQADVMALNSADGKYTVDNDQRNHGDNPG